MSEQPSCDEVGDKAGGIAMLELLLSFSRATSGVRAISQPSHDFATAIVVSEVAEAGVATRVEWGGLAP